MPRITAAERLSLEKFEFIEKVKLGVPQLHACFDVGWSPAKLARLMKERDFRSEVEVSSQYRDESLEMVLYKKAMAGHTESLKMWLEHSNPGKWGSTQRVEVQHTGGVAVGVIDATRDALRAFLSDPSARNEAIAALAPGGILDAEVIEDDVD